MTFQECESHPLWQAFKEYEKNCRGWAEGWFVEMSKSVWWKDWETFLAGAQAENKRMQEAT